MHTAHGCFCYSTESGIGSESASNSGLSSSREETKHVEQEIIEELLKGRIEASSKGRV
jgi:hypothetical protein